MNGRRKANLVIKLILTKKIFQTIPFNYQNQELVLSLTRL